MYKLLQYHTQVNAGFGAKLRKLRRQLLSAAAIHPVAKLNARIEYDIGLNDSRPEVPTLDSLRRAEATQLEAIRSRLM